MPWPGRRTSWRAWAPSPRSASRPSRAPDRGYDARALRPGAIAPRRRTLLLALACALALVLVAAPQALGGALTPESGGSPNANDIDTLYKIVLYVALVIFLLVESILIWSLVKFRRRRGAPPAPAVRGHKTLAGWWDSR